MFLFMLGGLMTLSSGKELFYLYRSKVVIDLRLRLEIGLIRGIPW